MKILPLQCHVGFFSITRRISYLLLSFSRSVVSDSLRPHGLQHARPPCPSQLPEPAQTHAHRVGEATQPSRPLPPPSHPALSLSRQGSSCQHAYSPSLLSLPPAPHPPLWGITEPRLSRRTAFLTSGFFPPTPPHLFQQGPPTRAGMYPHPHNPAIPSRGGRPPPQRHANPSTAKDTDQTPPSRSSVCTPRQEKFQTPLCGTMDKSMRNPYHQCQQRSSYKCRHITDPHAAIPKDSSDLEKPASTVPKGGEKPLWFIYLHQYRHRGFASVSVAKESACNAGDPGSVPVQSCFCLFSAPLQGFPAGSKL